MRSRRRPAASLPGTCLLLLALIAAPPIAAQEAKSETVGARITYVTGASIYLDAGRSDGLREGDIVEVIREGRTIATLKVAYLSDRRASCEVVSAALLPAVGDLVQFAPHAAAGVAAEPSPPPPRSRTGWGGLHGRIGVRYLAVKDNTGLEDGFSQPAFDLRVDGAGVGGSDFDVNLDVRARRTYRTGTGAEDDSMTRVYRLATRWRVPDSRQSVTVGRQFAPALEALSIFDGALYDVDGDRWGAGVFAGTQPDAADFGVDGTVREYGGYWVVHSPPQASRPWAVTLGLIDSYAEGDVNREWFYLQARYRGPRLSGFFAQEVDYNRSWKTDEAGEGTLEPTSTFAIVNFRAGEKVTFHAGYDNRRNIRLWLDRVTPATAFDESYRQGGWAGASFRLGRHFVIGGDGRVSTGGPSGGADGYSGTLGWDGLGRANLSFNWRSTRFTNDRSDGWLHALTAGTDLGHRAHLEVAAGRVEETALDGSSLDREDDWLGIDLDLLVARNWFITLSAERYTGTFQDNDQAYAAVSYRF